jgi:uncharacterized protein (DUF488 family)
MKTIFTIGYTQKSAKNFFEILTKNKIDILIDIRLNNTGQLAGFTKKDDLQYFLKIFNISYEYWKDFAPTKELRDNYHKTKNWNDYEIVYKKLLKDRKVINKIDFSKYHNKTIVLLCSEPKADRCHRRLAAEEISKITGKEIGHL